MGQSTHKIAAFGLRKIRECTLKFLYILQRWGFTATFILGPFFFEEISPRGPVTCSVTGCRHHDMLHTFAVQQLQEMRVLTTTSFMQDGAPPHIIKSVKALLLQYFTDEPIISENENEYVSFVIHGHHVAGSKSVRFLVMGPCLMYHGGVAMLNDLKNSLTLRVQSITTDQLQSTIECTVHRLEILQVNEGGHMENLSLHRPGHD